MSIDTRPTHIPLWLSNLLLFGLLIGFVLSYFFWQMHQIDRTMQNNAMERSRLVAGIIEESLKNAETAADAIEEITYTLLNDKAHFIDYLDSIEPLEQSELTALSQESGLAGISLIRETGKNVSGPANWLESLPDCNSQAPHIYYDHPHGTAYMSHPMNDDEGDLRCVIVGFDAARIFAVQEKTSLSVILATLSKLPGIHYIRLVDKSELTNKKTSSVTLINNEYGYTAEAVVRTSKGFVITNELQPISRAAVALEEFAWPRMPNGRPWYATQTFG